MFNFLSVYNVGFYISAYIYVEILLSQKTSLQQLNWRKLVEKHLQTAGVLSAVAE